MFSGLFGGKGLPILEHDWHPDLDKALALFKTHNWPDLSLLLARQSMDGGFRLIQTLGDASPLDMELDKFPRTPAILNLLAGIHICWAWRHRTAAPASQVSDMAWRQFNAGLDGAIELLNEVLEIQPRNALALGSLARAYTGKSNLDGLNDVRDRLFACDAMPLGAATTLLMAYSPKWLGEGFEASDAIVRAALDHKGTHPARYALVARAHIEKWLYNGFMQDGDEAQILQGQQHLQNPDTIQDLVEANRKFHELMTNRPGKNFAAMHFAHNNFGFAFYKARRLDPARTHISAIANLPDKFPWGYLAVNDISQEWPAIRKSVGLSRKIRTPVLT